MKKLVAGLAVALGVFLIYAGVIGYFVVPEIYSFDVKVDASLATDADGAARAVAGVDTETDVSKIANAAYITAASDALSGYLAASEALATADAAVDDVQAKLDALAAGADSTELDAALEQAKSDADAAKKEAAAQLSAVSKDVGLARLAAQVELGLATPAQKVDDLARRFRLELVIAGGVLVLAALFVLFATRRKGAKATRRLKYAQTAKEAPRARGRVEFNLSKLLAPMALVILYIFFSVFGNRFFEWYTLKTILESAYFIGIMAFGVSFVIMTGGIDLSIGTNMMCAALLGGYAFGTWGWPLWLAILLVPAVGLFFGVCNGFMVAKLKLPPFIATLGTMLVTQGFGSIVTSVQTQRYPTIGTANQWFKTVFYRAGEVPIGAIFLGVAFLVALFLLVKTKFGRYTLAIGSNEEAARLSGVKTDNWKILVYAACGLFAGIAGIFYASTYTTIIPGTGNGQELNAIAGVVIGGTSMAGGSGSIVGTLIGVFIMAVLKSGLSSLGLQSQWQTFFTGFVVIGAVLLDIWRTNTARRVRHTDSNPAEGRTNK